VYDGSRPVPRGPAWTCLLFGLAHATNLISEGPKALVQVLVTAVAGYFFYLIRRVSHGLVVPVGAVEDRWFTTEQAELLDSALTAAGVEHTVEFYPAHHGFAVPDNDTYDPVASARHWEALRQLYQARL
jgi:dienelactone hydrolase